MKKRIALVSVVALTLLTICLPAQAAGSKKQNFTILLNTEEGGPVIATGAFVASGWDVEHPDGESGIFKFPGGNLNIAHKTSAGSETFRLNELTCVGKFVESGTYHSTSGTGAYKGTSVSGTYRVKGTVTFSHTAGGCSEEPVGFGAVIRARGTISWAM